MEREIKFKYGYSDGINTFEKSFTLDDIEQGLQFKEISDIPLLRNYKIIYKRQYAGRKDKNGVEIYEGDRIKGGIYDSYEVKWDNKINGWNISSEYNIKMNYEVVENKLNYLLKG